MFLPCKWSENLGLKVVFNNIEIIGDLSKRSFSREMGLKANKNTPNRKRGRIIEGSTHRQLCQEHFVETEREFQISGWKDEWM